jgi:hypothetical protein
MKNKDDELARARENLAAVGDVLKSECEKTTKLEAEVERLEGELRRAQRGAIFASVVRAAGGGGGADGEGASEAGGSSSSADSKGAAEGSAAARVAADKGVKEATASASATGLFASILPKRK